MFEMNVGALVQSWFFQGVSSSIHRLNRRCLKLASVQLSSELVFSGISEVILTGETDNGFELTSVQLSRDLVF